MCGAQADPLTANSGHCALTPSHHRRSLQLQNTPHHRDTSPADPHPYKLAVSFLSFCFQQARAPHVYALSDPQSQHQIRLVAQPRKKSDESNIGTTCRRVLGDAVERREHPCLEVDVTRVVFHIEEDASRSIGVKMIEEYLGVRPRCSQSRSRLQFGENEWKRHMIRCTAHDCSSQCQ